MMWQRCASGTDTGTPRGGWILSKIAFPVNESNTVFESRNENPTERAIDVIPTPNLGKRISSVASCT